MSTELEVKKTNALAPTDLMNELMDDNQVVDSRDLILPKILLTQSTSQSVHDEKAAPGELRDSLNNRLLGKKDQPVEVIFFYFTKTWVIFEELNGKMEYKTEVPFGPDNADWGREDVIIDGVKTQRNESINIYCALPSEIQAGKFLPYMISFRRTSYVAGKKILSAFQMLKMSGKPPASMTFLIQPIKKQNEKGTFHLLDAAQGRDTTPEEQMEILPWFRLVKKAGVKVDDSDLRAEGGRAASVVSEPVEGEMQY